LAILTYINLTGSALAMGIIKKIYMLISSILLLLLVYVGLNLIEQDKKSRVYKSDYATLHSVQYGILNSHVWTSKITHILDKRIENFDLDTNNREEIKGYIQTIIDTLIVEADRALREHNKGKRGFFDSILGSTKQMITDSLVDIRALRKRVPEFTNAVMKEIEKPENQARAKKVIRDKLKKFMNNNMQIKPSTVLYDAILTKYKMPDLKTCTTLLSSHMQDNSKKMNEMMYILLGLATLIILLTLFQGILNSVSLLILSGTMISLLTTGIFLPMIDIEAKISKLTFTILDHTIIFENQILFFQSKSISDLVRLLLESGESKMMLVGLLLVMFSIIFPALKLVFSYLHFYSQGFIGKNVITRFFALRSSKWSMADVMVVSIFMAYLGLDGVVGNELKHLERQNEASIDIITTNGTHLEVGFYLFLSFVITSFILSILLENAHNKRKFKK